MEYTVLTCWYRVKEQPGIGPGNGPYSKIVTAMLKDGWKFKGELQTKMHTEEGRVYVLLIQEFTKGKVEE